MRILIVDDSATVARQLGLMLRDLQHEVVGHAKSGAEAIRLVAEFKPDLIFLDLVMPEMDGIAALRNIRALDPKVRVIVLSSVAGVGSQVDDAIRLGAQGFTAKPFTASDIRKALDRFA